MSLTISNFAALASWITAVALIFTPLAHRRSQRRFHEGTSPKLSILIGLLTWTLSVAFVVQALTTPATLHWADLIARGVFAVGAWFVTLVFVPLIPKMQAQRIFYVLQQAQIQERRARERLERSTIQLELEKDERQKAEESLNRERHFIETLMAQLPDYIFVKDEK